jgi:hypothetical protein
MGQTVAAIPSGESHPTRRNLKKKLRFVTRKRLVKTLQGNSHCGELLPSKD